MCEGLFLTGKARETEANLTFVGSRLLRGGEDVAAPVHAAPAVASADHRHQFAGLLVVVGRNELHKRLLR